MPLFLVTLVVKLFPWVSKIVPFFKGIWVKLAAVVVALVFSFGLGYHYGKISEIKDTVKSNEAVVLIGIESKDDKQKSADDMGIKVEKTNKLLSNKNENLQTEIKLLHKKIDDLSDPESDAEFVRLYNKSAEDNNSATRRP